MPPIENPTPDLDHAQRRVEQMKNGILLHGMGDAVTLVVQTSASTTQMLLRGKISEAGSHFLSLTMGVGIQRHVRIEDIVSWRAERHRSTEPLIGREILNHDEVEFGYLNHRGEARERVVRPLELWFGGTLWHPEAQWFLQAFDLMVDGDPRPERSFAVQDIEQAQWRIPDKSNDLDQDDAKHVCPDNHLYYCPEVEELESLCHGGFDTCCGRPNRHVMISDFTEMCEDAEELRRINAFLVENGYDFPRGLRGIKDMIMHLKMKEED